jgi:hypothetical protein
MKVIEVTAGVSYETARELPNDKVRPTGKSVGRKGGGNSGSQKKKERIVLPGKLKAELQATDREITEAHKMVLWLVTGKRKLIRASEYERLRAQADSVTGKGVR